MQNETQVIKAGFIHLKDDLFIAISNEFVPLRSVRKAGDTRKGTGMVIIQTERGGVYNLKWDDEIVIKKRGERK